MTSAPSIRKQRKQAEREARRAVRGRGRPPLLKAALVLLVLALVIGTTLAVRTWLQDPLTRGREALAAGNFRAARVDLMNAVAARPNEVSIRLDLAHAYNGLRRGVEAERQLRRASELGGSPAVLGTSLAEAQLLQGQPQAALDTLAAGYLRRDAARAMRIAAEANYRLGDFGKAQASFDESLRLGPDQVENWVAFARFRLAEQDMLGADYAATQAWRRAPRSSLAFAIKADVVRTREGPVAAIAWYEAAAERDPDNVPVMLEWAASLGEAGHYRDMLKPLRRAAELEPGNGRALFLMSLVAARAGDWPLARTFLARIAGPDADQPAVLQARAAVELALDTPSAAERFAAALVAQQPDNATGRRLLALAQVRGDNPRGAMMTLDPITIRADADSWSLLLLANSFSGMEWQMEARQPLDRATRLMRGDPPPLPAASDAGDSLVPSVAIPTIRARLARGDASGALSLASRLSDANPGVPQARLLVGDALMMLGNESEAAEQFRRASQLRYDEPVMLRLFHALVRSGDRQAAAEALRQFQMRWPENVAAMRIAAAFSAEQGDWVATARQLRAALARTGPNDALLLAQIARSQLELGDAESAVDHARRAYRLLPGNATVSGLYGIALLRTGGNRTDAQDLMAKALRLAPDDPLLRAWQAETSATGQ